MGKLSKKIIDVILLTTLFLFFSTAALGEQAPWDCPECGRKGNTGNFCGWCAHPAPTMETTSPNSFEVGKTVLFGRYEQDNNKDNGPEEIEWIVLERDEANHTALLISKYGLDAKRYNYTYKEVTWETCTLRSWLNVTFLNKAFTSQEQTGIRMTIVDNSSRQGWWSTDSGNNTLDKVFLLSYAEANRYLGVTFENSNNTKSRVAPTAYAIKQGAETFSDKKTADGTAAGWWWLRSPGNAQGSAAHVHTDGSLSLTSVRNGNGCVRPALWINLESDIF